MYGGRIAYCPIRVNGNIGKGVSSSPGSPELPCRGEVGVASQAGNFGDLPFDYALVVRRGDRRREDLKMQGGN